MIAAAKKHLFIPEEYNPLSNAIDVNKLRLTHFLTQEEDALYKDRKPNRVYKVLQDENDLSDVFGG